MTLFVLNYWLREFRLSATANHLELQCQSKATDAIVLQCVSLFQLSQSHVAIVN